MVELLKASTLLESKPANRKIKAKTVSEMLICDPIWEKQA